MSLIVLDTDMASAILRQRVPEALARSLVGRPSTVVKPIFARDSYGLMSRFMHRRARGAGQRTTWSYRAPQDDRFD